MRHIAVLLTAVSLAGCAASLNNNAGGIWGKPAEMTSTQTTGPGGEVLMAQADVARPSAASSSKGNGLASDGPRPRQGTGSAIGPPGEAAQTAAFVTAPANSAYKIGPLDTLDISVFQVPDLSKSVQVSATGTVNLPLVGEIPVAGRTAREVERDLTSRLGAKYLQNPQVTVYVKDYSSQRVTIDGSVNKPGVYPIKGQTSLLQVVAMAEGLNADSDSTVLVIRESDGKRSAAKFDVNAIQKGTAEDPTLQAGDTVVAGKSAIKAAFNTILKATPIAGTAEQAATIPVAPVR